MRVKTIADPNKPHEWMIYVQGDRVDYGANPNVLIWRPSNSPVWHSMLTNISRGDLIKFITNESHKLPWPRVHDVISAIEGEHGATIGARSATM